MLIQVFPSGPYSTNAYLVGCQQTSEAAIIDPAPGSAKKIIPFISEKQWKITSILLTHSHWDHIADVHVLKETYHVPVYVHFLDAPNLKNPGTDQLPIMMEITGVEPDIFLEEGKEISVGNLHFQVIHTPGHSPGSVCFYESSQNLLLSGDTVFKGAIGNTSFPTSQPSLMRHSLDKLAKLPPSTKVLPGHGPSTTIQAELGRPYKS